MRKRKSAAGKTVVGRRNLCLSGGFPPAVCCSESYGDAARRGVLPIAGSEPFRLRSPVACPLDLSPSS